MSQMEICVLVPKSRLYQPKLPQLLNYSYKNHWMCYIKLRLFPMLFPVKFFIRACHLDRTVVCCSTVLDPYGRLGFGSWVHLYMSGVYMYDHDPAWRIDHRVRPY